MEATEISKLTRLEDEHWWYAERRHLLRAMVRECFPSGAAGRVAIDVGAAGGGNTRVLRDLGMLAVPVEYELAGAEAARNRGFCVLQADARSLPIRDQSVDLVIAFDVLEHIEDDNRAVSEVTRVLRPAGHLLLAVPADMELWSAHDEAVGHVRRYSREQLTSLISSSGLVIEDVHSWNVLLRPLVALRRQRSTRSDLQELGWAQNTLLRAVVAAERYLPWLKGHRGVTLFVRARRAE